jgi:branched-chain amino acid transport system ATP-binding protein
MLEVTNISAFYGDIQALWDVSLTISEGEIVTLIGSNGSGKSTIMKAVAGLTKPREGNITFDGVSLGRLPSHRIVDLGISLVPEGRRLFPEMTVRENLDVGASAGRAREFKHSSMGSVFDLFPILQDRSRQVAGTLSGGEQQMLAIGRALMARPKLLLIDEMSLGLSPIVVDNILQAIKDVNSARNMSIALVEQDVGAALSIADRGYVVEHGRIVAEGDTKSLQCDGRITEAYLGVSLGEQAK